LPFTGVGVDTLVVDPRGGHLDRPRAGQHIPWFVVSVAHHLAVAVLVTLGGEPGDIGIHLGLQRLGQHPPRTFTHKLIDHRRRGRAARRTIITSSRIRDYAEHRVVPSRPTRQRRPCLEPSTGHREGTPLPAHPQIPSIAHLRLLPSHLPNLEPEAGFRRHAIAAQPRDSVGVPGHRRSGRRGTRAGPFPAPGHLETLTRTTARHIHPSRSIG
jgi:hypothetical protein